MKHGKKILAVLSAAAIAASMSLPAFAAGVAVSNMNSVAYMDTFKAEPEMREKILAARCEIVYGGQAWTVDGAAYHICPDGTKELLPEFSDLFPGWDVTEISEYARTKWSQSDGGVVTYAVGRAGPDGTKELLPEFSDLFPGWDVTEISEYARTKWSQSDGGVVTYAVGRAGIGYEAVVNLPKATASSLGYNFYSFTGDGSTVYAYAKSIPGDKYNIAIYDSDLKRDVAYEPNAYPGRENGCVLDSESGHRYDCRASSVGSSGHAKMIVEVE